MTDSTYDPGWVVELARQQFPDDHRLVEALAACTRVIRRCDCGCGAVYFVDPSPDTVGEDSDFGLRLVLPREGIAPVVVDLLPDGRVASIEG